MVESRRPLPHLVPLTSLAIVFLGVLFAAGEAHAQVPPCELLPGRPENTSQQTAGGVQACAGQYWVRRDANQQVRAGIWVGISLFPDEAAALKIASRPPQPGFRPAAYGNGGSEIPENAGIFHPDDQGDLASLTGERPTGQYEVSFRCGRYIISATADPSKGIEARRMLGELNERLKAESLCGGAAAASAPQPPAPPARPTTTVPPSLTQSQRRVFSVSGECVRQGQGLLCTAAASNPPDNVPLAQVRFMWSVDGAAQGSRGGTLNVPTLAPGPHVVGVKAFTPSTVSTDTFMIQVP